MQDSVSSEARQERGPYGEFGVDVARCAVRKVRAVADAVEDAGGHEGAVEEGGVGRGHWGGGARRGGGVGGVAGLVGVEVVGIHLGWHGSEDGHQLSGGFLCWLRG